MYIHGSVHVIQGPVDDDGSVAGLVSKYDEKCLLTVTGISKLGQTQSIIMYITCIRYGIFNHLGWVKKGQCTSRFQSPGVGLSIVSSASPVCDALG